MKAVATIINPKHDALNRYRLYLGASIMGFARMMENENCPVHWSVLRATLRGLTTPRDTNAVMLDRFYDMHEKEITEAVGSVK